MDSAPEIIVVCDPAELAETAARFVTEAAARACAERSRFMLALSGGETPRRTYERLARPPFRDAVPWDCTWIFFGDERAVPPDHAESNYRMAQETLLSKVPIPADHVFRMPGEAEDLDAAAAEHARELAAVFGTRRGQLPRFDLVLLGLGVDGHTASLFPGSPVLREVFRPVTAVHAAAAAIPERITLALPVFNAAGCVAFLATGPEKAKVVKSVLVDRAPLPATMVSPADGRLVWILDRDAASLLPANGVGSV